MVPNNAILPVSNCCSNEPYWNSSKLVGLGLCSSCPQVVQRGGVRANATLSQNHPCGPHKNADIKPERHVVDIPHLHLQPFFERHLISPMNLSPPTKARPHRMPAALLLGVVRQVSDKEWPRTDKAEITAENIP